MESCKFLQEKYILRTGIVTRNMAITRSYCCREYVQEASWLTRACSKKHFEEGIRIYNFKEQEIILQQIIIFLYTN